MHKKTSLFLLTIITSIHGINGQLRSSKAKQTSNIKTTNDYKRCFICLYTNQEKQFTFTSCLFCNENPVCTSCNDSFGMRCPTYNLDSLYKKKNGSIIPGNLARLLAAKHIRPAQNEKKDLNRFVYCLATELHEIQETNKQGYQNLVRDVKKKENTKLEKQIIIKSIDTFKQLKKNRQLFSNLINCLDWTNIIFGIASPFITYYLFANSKSSDQLPFDYYLH